MAVVNDDVITYRDLNEYLHSRYQQLKSDGYSETQIKEMAQDLEAHGLQRLIQDKLIINEANRKEMTIPKDMLDKRIDEIRSRYPSDDAFLQSLVIDGLSISDLRHRIEDQLKVQRLIETEIRSKIYVSPQEINDYYEANKAKFLKPERINLDSIFIAKKSDPASALTKMQEIQTKIKSGEDFRKIAEATSESPALGIVEKNKLLPQIENAVSNLTVNQVSDIVEVDNGFYLFKLLGRIAASTADLTEVKDQIQKMIFGEKFHESLEEWLTSLEKNTFIEIKTEKL